MHLNKSQSPFPAVQDSCLVLESHRSQLPSPTTLQPNGLLSCSCFCLFAFGFLHWCLYLECASQFHSNGYFFCHSKLLLNVAFLEQASLTTSSKVVPQVFIFLKLTLLETSALPIIHQYYHAFGFLFENSSKNVSFKGASSLAVLFTKERV